MTTIGQLSIAALFLPTVTQRAAAHPYWDYDPYTGAVWITNHDPEVLPAVILKSGSNGPTPLGGTPTGDALSGLALPIPGAVLDNGDQPSTITYLDFPPGRYFIGNVLEIGTPVYSITLEFYEGSIANPVQQGIFGVICPEPASLSLAGFSLLGVVAARRRRRPMKMQLTCGA